MKRIIIVVVAILAAGCKKQAPDNYEVKYAGALKAIMHDQDLSAKADLDSLLLGNEHLYAVGALDSLKGEILIENGRPLISKMIADSMHISGSASHHAALLVYSYVGHWQEIDLPSAVIAQDELESYIDSLARSRGIETPLPFRVEGEVQSVHYHVIRNVPGLRSHREHKKTAFSDVMQNEKVYITGFYSDQHQGVFTHHDSKVHMHVRNDAADRAGHVDDVQLGKNVQLFIPAY